MTHIDRTGNLLPNQENFIHDIGIAEQTLAIQGTAHNIGLQNKMTFEQNLPGQVEELYVVAPRRQPSNRRFDPLVTRIEPANLLYPSGKTLKNIIHKEPLINRFPDEIQPHASEMLTNQRLPGRHLG